ncbi:hypothetical protein BC832DRAFT_451710 [Gaertneriomyces semiglobifer]|nr:hypothetical protein BC832DRAFT_451710 [Gaertneriomyces semiglobifer]
MYGDASTLSLGPTCPRGRPPGEFPSSPYYQVTVTAGPVHQRHSHYSPPYPTPPVVSPRPNYPVHESGYYHPHYYDDPHYIHFGDTRSDCDADAYHKHVPGLYHHEQSVAAPVCSRTWDNHRPTASLCHCGRKDCPTGPSSPCTYGYGDRGAPHQTPPTVRPGYFTPNYHHCEKRPAWRPSPGSLPEAQYETTDARDRGDSCWHHLHGGSRGMPRPCACSDGETRLYSQM